MSHHHARWVGLLVQSDESCTLGPAGCPFRLSPSLFTPCQLSNRWTLTYFRVVVVAQSTLNHLRDSCHKGSSIKGNYILWRTVFPSVMDRVTLIEPQTGTALFDVFIRYHVDNFLYISLEWTRFPLRELRRREKEREKVLKTSLFRLFTLD